jgi:lipopolysaccharide/colanic/teichoic acid biosynthesis glycosyltransferase
MRRGSAGLLYEAGKRGLDVAVSSGGILLLAPLLAGLAVAVRCTSPGPVLFRQQRVGRRGRLFSLYKFRSMRAALGGPSITAAGDSRITPVGRWLRRWKLDELPQLVNVLRGDMSLIGPRPEVPHYVRLYDDEQRQVLSVRPGITGPTQIRFRDEERLLASQPDPESYYVTTLMPAKLALDLAYVNSRTLAGDLRLLLHTLFAVCGKVTNTSPRKRERSERIFLAAKARRERNRESDCNRDRRPARFHRAFVFSPLSRFRGERKSVSRPSPLSRFRGKRTHPWDARSSKDRA